MIASRLLGTSFRRLERLPLDCAATSRSQIPSDRYQTSPRPPLFAIPDRRVRGRSSLIARWFRSTGKRRIVTAMRHGRRQRRSLGLPEQGDRISHALRSIFDNPNSMVNRYSDIPPSTIIDLLNCNCKRERYRWNSCRQWEALLHVLGFGPNEGSVVMARYEKSARDGEAEPSV